MFPPALPEKSRLLHIGPTKTGTSALQWAMRRQRKELRGHGVHYPKGPASARNKPLQALLRTMRGDPGDEPDQAWDTLVAAVDRAVDRGVAERVLVSHENFAKMWPTVARRVVEELKVTHVIAAARSYDALCRRNGNNW